MSLCTLLPLAPLSWTFTRARMAMKTPPSLHSAKTPGAAVPTLLWFGAALVSCGPQIDLPTEEVSDAPMEWGSASFALTAETSDKVYALRHAKFSVTGDETLTLDSEESPNEPTLVRELPSGPYTVELQTGYQLVEITQGGDLEVQSILESPNPQSVLVRPEQITPVTFLFRTAGAPVEFGPGSLAIAIAVEKSDVPGLVLSEFMVNPSAVSDSSGEWIEVTNTSDETLSLQGCRVLRDGAGFTIETAVTVPAHGYVALANGGEPGFSPALVYSGLTLPNSAAFTLTLECDGTMVDSVSVDPSGWPLASGISAALDPESLSNTKNDAPAAWCLATTSYGTDFGTPGAANDVCSR